MRDDKQEKQEFNAYLGKRVKTTRLKLGLTREQLAELARVSDKFIYDIEVGKKGVSAWVLVKIAMALGVSMDWLAGDAGSI